MQAQPKFGALCTTLCEGMLNGTNATNRTNATDVTDVAWAEAFNLGSPLPPVAGLGGIPQELSERVERLFGSLRGSLGDGFGQLLEQDLGERLGFEAAAGPGLNCTSMCTGVEGALNAVVTPANLPSSSIFIDMRIQGLGAMYAFCIAVFISLSTGVWVDVLDDRLREELLVEYKKERRHRRVGASGHRRADHLAVGLLEGASEGAAGTAAQLSHGDRAAGDAVGVAGQSPGQPSQAAELQGVPRTLLAPPTQQQPPYLNTHRRPCDAMHVLLLLTLLATLVGSLVAPSFVRKVDGSIASALADLGIDFTKYISLWQMPGMTGRGSWLNLVMAATFTVFIIVGPIARVLSLLALLLLPLTTRRARKLYNISRYLVSYTAVEVMLIATPLIGMAFGPMSETMLTEATFPACKTLDQIYRPTGDIHRCLRIDVIPLLGYWFNVASVALMIISGFDGSYTAKYIHRRLYPLDQYPPPSLVETFPDCYNDPAGHVVQ